MCGDGHLSIDGRSLTSLSWRIDPDDVITASGGFCAPMNIYSFDYWGRPHGWPMRFTLFPRLDEIHRRYWDYRTRVETAIDVLCDRHDCGDGDGW